MSHTFPPLTPTPSHTHWLSALRSFVSKENEGKHFHTKKIPINISCFPALSRHVLFVEIKKYHRAGKVYAPFTAPLRIFPNPPRPTRLASVRASGCLRAGGCEEHCLDPGVHHRSPDSKHCIVSSCCFHCTCVCVSPLLPTPPLTLSLSHYGFLKFLSY